MSHSNRAEVILITGASKGLGKALTYHFAKQQKKLAICSRHQSELLPVKEKAEALGGTVVAVEADVEKQRDVDRFISVAEDAFGQIDVVINNASIFGPGPLELIEYPEQAFRDVLSVNVLNPFLVTKRVLPGMLNREQGLIINVTSAAGQTGFAEWGAYGISKFALEGLGQTWADELDGTGVDTCLLDPGEMNTTMHETAVPDCDYQLLEPEELLPLVESILQQQESVNGKRFDITEFLEGGSE